MDMKSAHSFIVFITEGAIEWPGDNSVLLRRGVRTLVIL